LVHRAARSGKDFRRTTAITVMMPAVMIAISAPEFGLGFAAAEIALSKKCMKIPKLIAVMAMRRM
jgi:hypothetical protein